MKNFYIHSTGGMMEYMAENMDLPLHQKALSAKTGMNSQKTQNISQKAAGADPWCGGLPVEKIKGVSERIVKPLHHLGIRTVRDLLLTAPFRYDDFSHTTTIARAQPNETATIRGSIIALDALRTWKKKMHITEATVEDASGSMKAVWYNQPFLARTLAVGKTVNLSGRVDADHVMQNPAYEVVGVRNDTTHTGRLVPVYRETRGLTSRWLRYLVKNALGFAATMDDVLQPEMLKRLGLPGMRDAIPHIHFPRTKEEAERAKKRLAFEELFLLQLLILQARAAIRHAAATSVPFDLAFVKDFVSKLSFRLTDAQRAAAWEIVQDMEKQTPMNRLLEGDVGSGKTVVAALAASNAAMRGWQCAFMAPTEILARQHFETFSKMCGHFPIRIGLLTASGAYVFDADLKTSYKIAKSELVKKISDGSLHILIGTHALIADSIVFPKLALVVLDEQHRFGVAQRAALVRKNELGIRNDEGKENSIIPHLLSMTATPIPRTLTLALYGDLDISLLKEMPKDRKKIETSIVAPGGRAKAYAFMREQVGKGRQAFVICPRIEISGGETPRNIVLAQVKTVKAEYEKLSKEVFPDLRIAMLHGKMKPKEKEQVMKDFKDGKTDILVSTSVVEVGVDVPNASVMAIEGAERFGLAQLHQFRGRVGRAEHQSYCLLFTQSAALEENRRLKAMITSNDGFALAEKDLAIRGPGDLLGGRQSGLPDLVMASLTDAALIKSAREEALGLLARDPQLLKSPKLRERLAEFNAKIHFE